MKREQHIDSRSVSIVFWGTPEFAIPALQELVAHKYTLVAVVTNPDEPAGRNQILTPPPVKVCAETNNIAVLQPVTLKNAEIKLPNADVFVVAAYGKIIPKEMLAMPKYGSLNIHPSLLPRWRGPSPIQYAILSGDAETGVSIMQIDELMDHGPVIAQVAVSIGSHSTYSTLHDTLSKKGAELLIGVLPDWINGNKKGAMQDDIKATYSKMLKKDDARIDWSKNADAIERMVRALNPKPGVWTIWPGEKICRVRIIDAEIENEEPPYGSPGYVWQNEKKELFVKTGKRSIRIKTLTIEGKKAMDARSFAHGHGAVIGSTFI